MLTVKSYCWICALPVWHTAIGVCYWCEQQLELTLPRCLRCGFPKSTEVTECEQCCRKPCVWDGLIPVGGYHPPLSKLLHQLKFAAQTAHVVMLSRLMLLNYLYYRRQYAWQKPDAIVVVPLHPKRFAQRGFNQSELLARPLARWLSCDYFPQAVRRVKATTTQHTLGRATRQRNLRHAFELTMNLAGLHIVVIDDVVTTGATVTEIVYLLQNQQVASVQVWCLCRTL